MCFMQQVQIASADLSQTLKNSIGTQVEALLLVLNVEEHETGHLFLHGGLS